MSAFKGIILRSQIHQESDCIITVFSERGLTNVFVKKGLGKYGRHRNNITPLTLSEIIYETKHNNLKILLDSTRIHDYNEIKQDYDNIMTAGEITSSLLSSQWFENPAPLLYSFFLNVLKMIPRFNNKKLLISTFLLKLMKHDGILDLTQICSCCQQPLSKEFFRYKGKILCKKHKTPHSLNFSLNEEIFLKTLAHCRKFQALMSLDQFDINLYEKINELFQQILSKPFTKQE